MVTLLTDVLPLALGAAISPTILAVAVLILAGRTSRFARSASFILGNVFVLVFVGVASLYILSKTIAVAGSPNRTGLAYVDVAAGVLLVLLGLWRFFRPAGKAARKHAGRAGRTGAHLLSYLLLGMATMATNVTTFALYLPAMKEIARAHIGFWPEALVFATVTAITLIPAYGPTVAYRASPRRASRALEGLNSWLQRHQKGVSVAVFGGFGVFLLAKGLRAL